MLAGYLINIAAKLSLIVIVMALSWAYIWTTDRRPLLSFFGVSDSRRLVLYWSNLMVLRGGAIGSGGMPRSYGGNAVPFSEATFLPFYQRLFNLPFPGLAEQPGIFRRLLLSDVTVEAIVAPTRSEEIDTASSIISFGSPGYNSVSLWIEQTHQSVARFANDNAGIQLPHTPILTDSLTGFVQRVALPGTNNVAFYVAGISSQATRAAAYLLMSRWSYLRKRFGDGKKFCLVLKADAADFRHSTILMEREG